MIQYRCIHCKAAYRPQDTRCPNCNAYEAEKIKTAHAPSQPVASKERE